MITFSIYPADVFSHNTTVEEIQKVAKQISLKKLKEKALEYGIKDVLNCKSDQEECNPCRYTSVDYWVEPYTKIPADDLTIYFTDEGVHQCASGGDGCREAKEIMRKAFIVLLIDECFKRGLGISLKIA